VSRGDLGKCAAAGDQLEFCDPFRVVSRWMKFRGYHFAGAPFNPRLPLFEPFGFTADGSPFNGHSSRLYLLESFGVHGGLLVVRDQRIT